MQCERGTWRQSCTPPECGHEVKGECVKVAAAGKGPASRGAYIRRPENVSILRTKYVSGYRNAYVGGNRLPFYCGIRYVCVGNPPGGPPPALLSLQIIFQRKYYTCTFFMCHVPAINSRVALSPSPNRSHPLASNIHVRLCFRNKIFQFV